jgi:ubiquinone biosynthesis protein
MGRLDRDTRFFLADMLVGFLSGDYRRVAEVHFAAGYVPRGPLGRRVRPGLPLGRRADPRQAARRNLDRAAPGAALPVTEQFEMETQPQLLLLQKTMVLIEGVGRQLDPDVNIWALARPLIEDLDAGQSRPRGSTAPAARKASSRWSTDCPI